MDASVVIGIVMSALTLTGFGFYLHALLTGRSVFYTSTRTVMLFASATNGISYLCAAGWDILKGAVQVSGGLGNVIVYSIVVFRGKPTKLRRLDWTVLVIGLLSCVIWMLTGKAGWANIILQAGLFISFIPTLVGIWRGNPESPWIYLIINTAQILSLVVIYLRWDNNWDLLVSPLMFITVNTAVIIKIFSRGSRVPCRL